MYFMNQEKSSLILIYLTIFDYMKCGLIFNENEKELFLIHFYVNSLNRHYSNNTHIIVGESNKMRN